MKTMHCLTVVYPRPDSEAAFKSYYEGTHIPMAAGLPGLRRHYFAYPDAVSPGDVFCIFQAYFDDAGAMGAAMNSAVGQKVAADVPNFSARGAQVFHFAVVT